MDSREVYKSDYLVITYYEDGNFLYIKWLPKVVELLEDEFKEEIMNYLKALDETGAQNIVVDLLDAEYPITDELGQWIIDVITQGLVDRNVRKDVHIYPKDYLTKIGFENFEQDLLVFGKLTRKFTSDIDEALEWVKRG